MSDETGPVLFDREYVKTCLLKAIEEKPAGYTYPEESANYYFDLDYDQGECRATPACLVGHVLGNLGVSDHMIMRMAYDEDTYNHDTIGDLARKINLPVAEDALLLLKEAQTHSDNHRPWDMFKPE